jgi:hypothetical protein
METRSRHSIREFVNSLESGTRVIWVANGTTGTVQSDKTILWDNGHHLTHKHMRDHHALLIHSEAEKRCLQNALAKRLSCLKRGCTLVHWDDEGYTKEMPERLCPLAILSKPELHPLASQRRNHMNAGQTSLHSPRSSAA